MLQILTPETTNQQSETINSERVARLGRLAIESEFLGINDPLTHLHQYLKRGEIALIGIKEDLETDIAERLPRTPFVNYVGFEFTSDDFVSLKDRISMNSMTETNLRIFKSESAKNPDLIEEFERAEIEAKEATKLAAWFKDAPTGAYLIFESLPMNEQKIAISRIYQKANNGQLQGCFVSLYNSSVNQFNELRKTLGADNVSTCHTEKEILQNCYEFYEPDLTTPNEFIDFYVGAYDYLLKERHSEQYSFGLKKDRSKEKQNGLLKVRSQPRLTSIYLDTIKALASSQGVITPELIQINDRLGIGYELKENQTITIEMAQSIMSEVILGITSVIDNASNKLLKDLEHSDINQETNYAAVSHYGEQAKISGETYVSNGCPEYGRSNSTETSADMSLEYNAIYRAFNIREKLDNFGKPKTGVCRILNCPSRGNLSWSPNKTLVGGCDICVCCHKLLGKGKSPKIIYAEKKLKEEKSLKKQAKLK